MRYVKITIQQFADLNNMTFGEAARAVHSLDLSNKDWDKYITE